MTPSEELACRKQQLRARDGKPGYKANCEALKARIAELEGKPVFIPAPTLSDMVERVKAEIDAGTLELREPVDTVKET